MLKFLPKKRNQAFEKAAVYFKRKNREAAAYFAQEGHEWDRKMKEANHLAARSVVAEMESSLTNNPYLVDMHGLKVIEAIEVLNFLLAIWEKNPHKPLTIITGTGKHSAGKKPKLKPAISMHLNQKGYKINEEEGQIIVQAPP